MHRIDAYRESIRGLTRIELEEIVLAAICRISMEANTGDTLEYPHLDKAFDVIRRIKMRAEQIARADFKKNNPREFPKELWTPGD